MFIIEVLEIQTTLSSQWAIHRAFPLGKWNNTVSNTGIGTRYQLSETSLSTETPQHYCYTVKGVKHYKWNKIFLCGLKRSYTYTIRQVLRKDSPRGKCTESILTLLYGRTSSNNWKSHQMKREKRKRKSVC